MSAAPLWLACMVLCPAIASAQPVQIEIADAGEVVAQDIGQAELLPGNLAEVTAVTAPRLIHPGHRIEGAFCRQFGFSFRATNLPPGEREPVTITVIHPRWSLPDGRSGTTESWTSAIEGDRWGYVGYAFTEDWSLVPGDWRFTVAQGDRILTEQVFTIDVAPGQALPLQGCAPSVS